MRKKCITGLLLISLCTGLVIPAHGNAAQKKWKLNVTKKTLTVKKSTTLKVKGFKKTAKSKIRWKSTKPKIASVNQKGVVKAKAKGKAKIRATILIKGKKKATLTCNIKVKKAAKNFCSKNKYTKKQYKSCRLCTAIRGSNNSNTDNCSNSKQYTNTNEDPCSDKNSSPDGFPVKLAAS